MGATEAKTAQRQRLRRKKLRKRLRSDPAFAQERHLQQLKPRRKLEYAHPDYKADEAA